VTDSPNNQYALNWPDNFWSEHYDFIKSSPYKWPPLHRRIYMLTWPIAYPLRCLVIVLMWVFWLTTVGVCILINVFYCAWHGIPNIMQEPDYKPPADDDA
jgi:hypothetical protein